MITINNNTFGRLAVAFLSLNSFSYAGESVISQGVPLDTAPQIIEIAPPLEYNNWYLKVLGGLALPPERLGVVENTQNADLFGFDGIDINRNVGLTVAAAVGKELESEVIGEYKLELEGSFRYLNPHGNHGYAFPAGLSSVNNAETMTYSAQVNFVKNIFKTDSSALYFGLGAGLGITNTSMNWVNTTSSVKSSSTTLVATGQVFLGYERQFRSSRAMLFAEYRAFWSSGYDLSGPNSPRFGKNLSDYKINYDDSVKQELLVGLRYRF